MINFNTFVEMDELMTSIDIGLKDINSRIPDINEGGCGIFATLLHDELVQLGMMTHAVVFNDMLPVWQVYHVALKHDGYYFDSDGVHKVMNNYNYAIESLMPMDVLHSEAGDSSLWHDGFNRELIPDLKKEIRTLGARVLTQKRESEIIALNF